MPQLGNVLEALLRNAPTLLFLLPVIGAVLALVSLPLGVQAVRRTAQSNALVTGLFALLAIGLHVSSDPPRAGGTIVEAKSWNWTATTRISTAGGERREVVTGPRVRFAFGMDGLNAWFAILTVLAMFPVLQLAPVDEEGAGFYPLILLLEACWLGAFLAMDVLLFCLLCESAVLLAFLLIGTYGGHERRAAAGRWLITQACSGALVLGGLMLVVMLRAWVFATNQRLGRITFDVVDLTSPGLALQQRITESLLWWEWAPWAFLLLLAGFALRAACFPLHTWFVPVSVESPRSLSLLLLIGGTKIGLYGVLRFVVPVFPEASIGLAPVVTAVAVGGVVFAALLTLAQGNLAKYVACASLVFFASALLSAFTLGPHGITGAVLLLVHHGCAVGLLAYVVHALAERYDTYDVEAYGGLARRFPRLALLSTLSILATAAVPGTLGFVGQLLAGAGLFEVSGRLLGGQLLGTFLLTWALLWTWNRLFRGRFREPVLGNPGSGQFPRPETARAEDLGWGECLSALPLIVVLFGLGCWPKPIVDSVGGSAAVILRSHDLVAPSSASVVPSDSRAE